MKPLSPDERTWVRRNLTFNALPFAALVILAAMLILLDVEGVGRFDLLLVCGCLGVVLAIHTVFKGLTALEKLARERVKRAHHPQGPERVDHPLDPPTLGATPKARLRAALYMPAFWIPTLFLILAAGRFDWWVTERQLAPLVEAVERHLQDHGRVPETVAVLAEGDPLFAPHAARFENAHIEAKGEAGFELRVFLAERFFDGGFLFARAWLVYRSDGNAPRRDALRLGGNWFELVEPD